MTGDGIKIRITNLVFQAYQIWIEIKQSRIKQTHSSMSTQGFMFIGTTSFVVFGLLRF